MGLIHQTYVALGNGEEWILQRVNPIFSPEIHDNILAVTEHLHARGVLTLRLIPTRDGRPWLDMGEGGRWRLMTRVPGATFHHCRSPAQAASAARLVARFHGALADLRHEFRPLGTPLHDTARHLALLREALHRHEGHRLHREVSTLADGIFGAAAAWEDLGPLPRRVIHGDLKFNNVVFAGESGEPAERAVSLIDLDTVSRMPLWVELGDAWRSWCNPAGESESEASLDLAIFEASARGYLEAIPFSLEPAERRSLAHGLERISLELSARFAADALNECYFAWDATRFRSAGDHNLLRARGQWSLHRQARETRPRRAEILLG